MDTEKRKLIQISSGQGPAECELAVYKYLRIFLVENKEAKIESCVNGVKANCYKSVVVSVPESIYIQDGTIKWIVQSPYRPKHKRKNWFIEVCSFQEEQQIIIDDRLIRFETFRSGGKGGQNVNKVETGARAIHVPTGITAESTTARTQHLNKKLALDRLMSILCARNENAVSALKESMRIQHELIIRGNPVRIYEGMEFQRIQ